MGGNNEETIAIAAGSAAAFVGLAILTVIAVKVRAKKKHRDEMYNLGEKSEEEGNSTEFGHAMRKLKRFNFNKAVGNLFGSNNASSKENQSNAATDASTSSESSGDIKENNSDIENEAQECNNAIDISPSLQEIDEVCFNIEDDKEEK